MLKIASPSLRLSVAVLSIGLLAFASPNARAAAPTCEGLFEGESSIAKGKFFAPSAQFLPDGRLDLRLTNSESMVGKTINAIVQSFRGPLSFSNIQDITIRYRADKSDRPYWLKLAEAFGLDTHIDPAMISAIPRSGPLLLVANHPHHGVEGIALAGLVSKIRPDVKVILTPLLEVVPDMSGNAIFMSPYATKKEAQRTNVLALREIIRGLENGQAFIIFPAASVSGKLDWSDKVAMDKAWEPGVGNIIRKVPATQVLPVFVTGQTSQSYQRTRYLADRLPKRLLDFGDGVAAAMHIREIGKRKDSAIGLVIGSVIPGTEVASWGEPGVIASRLRTATYSLKNNQVQRVSLAAISDDAFRPAPEPIAPPGDMAAITAELNSKAKVLFDMSPENPTKRMKVYVALGRDIPLAMREVGRLREITFRSVGEGTGRSYDIDKFDDHYHQLIVVDKKTGQIAGGYRLGNVREIMRTLGFQGIYSGETVDHSGLREKIYDHAIDVTRSFVTPEFQRSFALKALFGAIGQALVIAPEYYQLMGSVSISNLFSERSKGILLGYLSKYHRSPDADLVKMRGEKPPVFKITSEDRAFVESHPTFRELAKYVNDLEQAAGTGMEIPPLIGIYTSLGADVFDFTFDPAFGTLDAFIVSDISKLSFDVLKEYMGEEGAVNFVEYHRTHPH